MSKEPSPAILLVDDEANVLSALRRLLIDVDVKIFTANNGEEALEVLVKENISLIVSDQCMPQMTGVEMFKHAKKISPESVRILLTGYADIDVTVDAINNGEVKYYLNKPWDDTQLVTQIKESLESQKMKSENRRLTASVAKKNKQLIELNETLEHKVSVQTELILKQHSKLKKSFMETIKAFSIIFEMRFKEMEFHAHRVATLTKEIVKHLPLSEDEKQSIIIAAFLHDIGKIALPEDLLKKNKKFYSSSDIYEMQKHPIIGQSCLCSVGGFKDIALIIRHHHEDFDANGYPDKLKGDEIPLGARIIRIIDSYDREAYTTGYPDKKILNDASANMVKHSGTKFDPEIVKLIIKHDIGHDFFLQESNQSLLLRPNELEPGMIISEEIYTKSGMFLLPKGAKLSIGMIKRITKIDKADGISSGIHVVKENVKKGATDARIQHPIG